MEEHNKERKITDDSRFLAKTAELLESNQQADLEAMQVEQLYQANLDIFIQSKHTQAERVEDRLENLVDQQQALMQRTLANQPGLLSRPATKAVWQNQLTQQQARLQILHARLETVREIKDGMGIHAPRIEELATRKLRLLEPNLATDFDEFQEAQRRHQALLRKQSQDKQKQAQSKGMTLTLHKE